MDMATIGDIEKKIEYTFVNKRLLAQAFVRRSYSMEHPDTLDNEQLEFYGDEALEYYITRKMYDKFSSFTKDNQFYSEKTEHELTELKSQIVDTDSLANCIFITGFQDYLLMNKSDVKNNVKNSSSVMADLFEAIVGAVAVDSNWQYEKIFDVCEALLKLTDFERNYIKLLNNWCSEKGFRPPVYHLTFGSRGTMPILQDTSPFVTSQRLFKMTGAILILSELNIKVSSDMGSEYASYMDCAKKAYKEIQSREMKTIIGTPNLETAVNQLNVLYQKGFISEPDYSFTEDHDKNGNPIWHCDCDIENEDYIFTGDSSVKKEAKKEAALEALCELLKSGIN